MVSAGSNRIDLLQRVPTDLRRYLKYLYDLKTAYGSVLTFVQHERLHWSSAHPSGNPPFTTPSDYRILFNDWPYGIDPDVAHLVVWTKFQLEDDPAADDLTPKARAEIEDFVYKTFCDVEQGGLERDRVIWFKNWRSLKSVHALDHFHVMLYQAGKHFLARVTNRDRPMCEKMEDFEGQNEVWVAVGYQGIPEDKTKVTNTEDKNSTALR